MTESTSSLATYDEMNSQIESIFDPSLPMVSNLANAASILFWNLNQENRQVNWAGFYFLDHQKKTLYLSCFQGKVACTSIPLGKGVCGTAAQEKASFVVENVHNFPGHIACDSASESEIVVPLLIDDICIGVIDIDALRTSEFNHIDRQGLEKVAATISRFLKKNNSTDVLLR